MLIKTLRFHVCQASLWNVQMKPRRRRKRKKKKTNNNKKSDSSFNGLTLIPIRTKPTYGMVDFGHAVEIADENKMTEGTRDKIEFANENKNKKKKKNVYICRR